MERKRPVSRYNSTTSLHSSHDFSSLPEELVLLILAYLPSINDRKRVSQTCRAWCHIVRELAPIDTTVSLVTPPEEREGAVEKEGGGEGDRGWKFVEAGARAWSKVIRQVYVTVRPDMGPPDMGPKIGTHVLAHLSNVKFMGISPHPRTRQSSISVFDPKRCTYTSQVNDLLEKDYPAIGNLEILRLTDVDEIAGISHCKNLVELDITAGCHISCTDLSVLADCPRLERLHINSAYLLHLRFVRFCEQIVEISLHGAVWEGHDLIDLARCPNLKVLGIDYTPDIGRLTACASLTHLILSHVEHLSNLVPVGSLHGLTHVTLTHGNVPITMQCLNALPRLESLWLVDVSVPFYTVFATFNSLKELAFIDCITDALDCLSLAAATKRLIVVGRDEDEVFPETVFEKRNGLVEIVVDREEGRRMGEREGWGKREERWVVKRDGREGEKWRRTREVVVWRRR